MTSPETPLHDTIVVGGGVAGLTVAHDLAKRGYRVLLLEASERLGGVVARLELDGLELDAGAESFAVRGGGVAELLADLGMADDIVDPAPGGAWLRLAGRSVPLPAATLLGIPSQPLARDVIAAIGIRGALRAWLDRVMPLVKIGKDRALGPLVTRRMGRAVLERLVAPISGGVYSSDARNLDVALVAPGLNEAMSRAGSLSGGVAQLVGEGARPGSAVQGIRGGMHRLPAALAAAASKRRVEIRTEAAVTSIARTERGWSVESGGAQHEASSLVLAVPAAAAAKLLADIPGFEVQGIDAPGASVELITLVVDRQAVDEAHPGSGALVSESAGLAAKALTHASAKWPWLAEAAGDRAVVRVSYGRLGEPPATAGLDDDAAFALARAEASTILGVALPEPRAAARVRWQQAQPTSVLGTRERQQRVRAAVETQPTLEIVGAWIAGTGLAQVIPDARAAALRIRREEFAEQGTPWTADEGRMEP